MNTTTANQLTVKDTVKNMAPEFEALLKSSGTDVNKFMNNALLAISDKPEIQSGEVNRRSVFNVCSRAANDGVVLDGKEAALVLGWNSQTKQKEAQYRLMAAGVIKQIQRSSEIERIVCQLVYENDDFLVDFCTDKEAIVHKLTPEALKKGRGEVVGVYFTAKMKSGEWTSPEIMSVAEVNAVRDAFSKTDKEGNFSKMWRDSWGEAARKTVLHRAKKRLPLTEKAAQVLQADEQQDYEIVDSETGEVSTITEPKKTTRAADKVKAAVVKTVEAVADEKPAEKVIFSKSGDAPVETMIISEEELPI